MARVQHLRYEEALALAGCRIRRLAPMPEFPDSVFVEDTAVVLDHTVVIARPGAASRRMEVTTVANVLEALRPITYIDPPGTLDGGDVLRIGRQIFVGLSSRTNKDGAAMLEAIASSRGYHVTRVPVARCLHLKSAVTAIDDGTVLLNPDRVDRAIFADYEVVEIDRREPEAANVLRIGEVLICASGFPFTRSMLDELGCRIISVNMSEFAKAEGAVTCCSIILDAPRAAAAAA
ncbi:MAG: arginine deiminase family protein [Rhodothermales bacterium]|nr:arginine deiminase family protein [Rhodothermales bacterium]